MCKKIINSFVTGAANVGVVNAVVYYQECRLIKNFGTLISDLLQMVDKCCSQLVCGLCYSLLWSTFVVVRRIYIECCFFNYV